MDYMPLPALKSARCSTRVCARFFNRTYKEVDIIWYDFDGDMHMYRQLRRNQHVDINTYENHPWIFVNAKSGENMVVYGKPVYEPKPKIIAIPAADGREAEYDLRQNVYITYPLFSLKRLCISVLSISLNGDNLDELGLPSNLLLDIKGNLNKIKTISEARRVPS